MPSTEHTHRYAELTWPEVAERVADDPVCVIPVATLEDHGYHLPIDTDAVIAEALAERAVLARPEQSLLLPTVTHGYTPHHMDFPGSITIEWKRFVEYLVDIGKSLIHHGFRRILFVNGHGSNVPLVDMAARLLMLERRDVIAATFWYLSTPESAELLARTRDSDQPGGMAHACELETSLYLAIHPERVQMDKAVREIPDWDSDTVWMDWNDGPLSIKGQWSGWTESGVIGDATVATAEKGRIWLDQAVYGGGVPHRRAGRSQAAAGQRSSSGRRAGAWNPGGNAMSSRRMLAAAALAAVLLAAGCGGSSGSSGGSGSVKQGGVFTIGTTNYIDTLNPFNYIEAEAVTAYLEVYPELVQLAPNLTTYEGSYATSVDAQRRLQDLHLHAAPRRQVVGRQAADLGRRGLDGEHDRQVPVGRDRQRGQLRRARHQGGHRRPEQGDLPLRRGGRPEPGAVEHLVALHPARARLGQVRGQQRQGSEDLPAREQPAAGVGRPVPDHQVLEEGHDRVQAQPGLLGRASRTSRRWAWSTTPTPTR